LDNIDVGKKSLSCVLVGGVIIGLITGSNSLALPVSGGVKLGKINYIPAETSPNPALERAILKQLPGYDPCAGEKIRYFYNQSDLNEDSQPETIVYLVGSYSCGTGGCNALIFKSSASEYQLISQMTLVNNPIIVSSAKTKGWHDLIIYVAGGGARGSYHLLRFNGKNYPSNPSIQTSLPPGFTIVGKALIADEITFNTPAPTLECNAIEWLKIEGFGFLRIGLSAAEISRNLGVPEIKEKKVLQEADGLYHQTWNYVQKGIKLDMVASRVEGDFSVASISLKSPSLLKTKRGIGIGSSYAETKRAYEKEYNREESTPGKQLIVGSVYEGLIFSFKDERVVGIFLGAAAE